MRPIKVHPPYKMPAEDRFKQHQEDPERLALYNVVKSGATSVAAGRFLVKDLASDLNSNGTMILRAIETGANACLAGIEPRDAMAVVTVNRSENSFSVCAKSLDGKEVLIPADSRYLNVKSMPEKESPRDVTLELRWVMMNDKGVTALVISYVGFWEKIKNKFESLKWKKH